MADGSKDPATAQPWRQLGDGHAVPLPDIDREAFAADISALRRELIADLGPADLAHLRKMERWGRACTLLGYALAWMVPNPIAALLLALGLAGAATRAAPAAALATAGRGAGAGAARGAAAGARAATAPTLNTDTTSASRCA